MSLFISLLYNFQGNKVAPLLPWTIVVLRNDMAIADNLDTNNDLVCRYP